MSSRHIREQLNTTRGELQSLKNALRNFLGEMASLGTKTAEQTPSGTKEVQSSSGLKKQPETVAEFQECFDTLTLSGRYLFLDLEATYREKGYLRKMLEETQGS